jgi:hypothetical protein
MSRTPEEILAGLPEIKVAPARVRNTQRSSDKPVLRAAVEEAVKRLAKTPPAIEGQGGQAHTGVVCIQTLALIPDAQAALEAMRDWNARCEPPWDEDELLARLERAAVEADVEPGSRANMAEARAQSLIEADGLPGPDTFNPSRKRNNPDGKAWNFSTLAEAENLPEPTWHFPGILPASGMGVVYGEPEKGKTWLVLDLALRLATGLGGLGRSATAPVDVVVYAGEGIRGIATKRANAWFTHHGLQRHDARLLLTGNPPNVSSQQSMDAFCQGIRDAGYNPGLIVFDTYARVLGEANLSENDPLQVNQFVQAADELKERFGCMILAIHHSGKDTSRGARGSNSLRGAIDVEWAVDANWTGKRVVAYCTKMKDWERPKDGLAFEVVDVEGTGGLVLEPLAGRDATDAVEAVAAASHDSGGGRRGRRGGSKPMTAALENGMVGEVLGQDKARVWTEAALRADLHSNFPELGSLGNVRMKLEALRNTTGGTAFYMGKQGAHHWRWREPPGDHA